MEYVLAGFDCGKASRGLLGVKQLTSDCLKPRFLMRKSDNRVYKVQGNPNRPISVGRRTGRAYCGEALPRPIASLFRLPKPLRFSFQDILRRREIISTNFRATTLKLKSLITRLLPASPIVRRNCLSFGLTQICFGNSNLWAISARNAD